MQSARLILYTCKHLDLSRSGLNFSCKLYFSIGINGFMFGFLVILTNLGKYVAMLIVKKLRIFRVSINDLIKSCERPQLPCSCISKEDIRTEPSNFCSPLCTDRNPDLSFGHRHLYNCISSARTSEEKIFRPKNYREEFSTIWLGIKWLHRSTSSSSTISSSSSPSASIVDP